MTVLLGTLVLVAFPRFVSNREVSYASAVDEAAQRGIVLAQVNPKVGTDIYQWDPEFASFPPLRLGAVTDSNVPFPKHHFVRIKSAYHLLNGTCLDIDPQQMRYWVRR